MLHVLEADVSHTNSCVAASPTCTILLSSALAFLNVARNSLTWRAESTRHGVKFGQRLHFIVWPVLQSPFSFLPREDSAIFSSVVVIRFCELEVISCIVRAVPFRRS